MVAGSKKCVFVALVMDCARPGARSPTFYPRKLYG